MAYVAVVVRPAGERGLGVCGGDLAAEDDLRGPLGPSTAICGRPGVVDVAVDVFEFMTM